MRRTKRTATIVVGRGFFTKIRRERKKKKSSSRKETRSGIRCELRHLFIDTFTDSVRKKVN